MNNIKTLQGYLNNPMGVGSAIPGKQVIYDDLKKRFDTLLRKKPNMWKHKVYTSKTDYYIHITVPSETERSNTYDVVFKLYPSNEFSANSPTLRNYGVLFFSNSPSFTYTFANTFAQKDLIVDELLKKFDDEVLKNKPHIRNPSEIIHYEKSIFFAIQYLMSKDLLDKKLIEPGAEKFSTKKFVDEIRHTDRIKKEIDSANNEIKREKARKADEAAGRRNAARRGPGMLQPASKQTPMMKQGKKSKITPRGSSTSKIKPIRSTSRSSRGR